ncbi:hypothetical protein ACHAXR_011233 [Thalassiosira sp. AJA248-18]
MTTTSLYSRIPIPQRIAGFALTATLLILALGLGAHHNFQGEILDIDSSSPAASSLRTQQYVASDQHNDEPIISVASADPSADGKTNADSYLVFLQKFPLESSFKMIFHTEVIVCPRDTFSNDPSFLSMLDGLLDTLTPSRFDNDEATVRDTTKSPFAVIEKEQWSKQSEQGCVQLGYGGANCGTGCCGSPSKYQNRNYALNSQNAVIGNAMGDFKELYFYGTSGSSVGGDDVRISGEDAYKSVCHGHMNAIEMGQLPKCVSNWAGRDYNPLTNNCNTFTSTVLKCVYGLSDAKPNLGVSDMISVTCPNEKKEDGSEVSQCVVPTMDGSLAGEDEIATVA